MSPDSRLAGLQLDRRQLDLTRASSACLRLNIPKSLFGPEKSLILVVDVYAHGDAVHPQRHLVYRTRPVQLGREVSVEFVRRGDELDIQFPEWQERTEHWRNPELDCLATGTWEAHIVLLTPDCTEVARECVFLETSAIAWRQTCELRAKLEHEAAELAKHCASYSLPGRPRVHVISQDVRQRDAIGNFALEVYSLCRAWGLPVTLHAHNFDRDLRGLAEPYYRLNPKDADIVWFQHSSYDPDFEWVAGLPCRKVLYFQNITPPEFFAAGSRSRELSERALEQLELAGHFDVVMASSSRTAETLREHAPGLARPILLCPPVLAPQRRLQRAAEPFPLPPASRTLLYVGRLAAHKRVPDVIELFDHYRRLDEGAVLLVVGKIEPDGLPPEIEHRLAELPEAARRAVVFLGSINEHQLKHVYERCSALVMMSEHEGFCLPVLEALAFGKPVFARTEPAVGETLGGAGATFAGKDLPHMAATIHAVLHDEDRLADLALRARHRFNVLAERASGAVFHEAFRQAMVPHACAV